MLYDESLKFDLKYEDLYKMDMKELGKTLEQRRKGLAYTLWKTSMLTGWATMGKNYPNNPEDACKELFPPKKSIPMPIWLRQRMIKKGGVR